MPPGLEGTGNEYSPQRSYTGREPDAAIGLIYYRARWYDPTLGRFISEDPIGFSAGDANLSRYVGNSTTNAVDPSGLDEFSYVAFAGQERWTLRIPFTGTSSGDIAKATEEMTRAFPDFDYNKLNATWHHREFDSHTGEFVMDLVDRTKHASISHTGGFAQYLDWVADTVNNADLDSLTDDQLTGLLKTLRNEKLLSRVRGRLEELGSAVEIVSKKLVDRGHKVTLKAGETVVEIVGKKAGRSISAKLLGWSGAAAKKGLPVVCVLWASGSAYANTGSTSEALDAAARELTNADLIEGGVRLIVVEGGKVAMDNLVSFNSHVRKRFSQLPQQERDEYIRDVIRDSHVEYNSKAMEEIAESYRKDCEREGKIGWYDRFLYDVAIPAYEWLNGPLTSN